MAALSPSPLAREGMQGGSKLPPSETPLLARDIGGAFGASLRAGARRLEGREDAPARAGEAHSYAPGLPREGGGTAIVIRRQGIDVLAIDRMALAVRRSGPGFLGRAFTAAEIDY